MNKNKKIIFVFMTFAFFCESFFVFYNFISANNNVEHIVISKIQIGGETVYDEFIELYNPTEFEIDLSNWDLKRKTKKGSESNILNNIEGVIPAHGYFLIVPRTNCGDNNNENCYKGLVIADDEYTTNSFLARNNTVLLYDDNENLVDKVGWGETSDFESEVIINNPENNQNLERININGVIQDTNNNKNDFVLKDISSPRNSNSYNSDGNNSEQNGSARENMNNSKQKSSTRDNGDNSKQEDSTSSLDHETSNVIVTEFLPNPKDSDKDNEFIEIYNDGSAEVNLSGWILEDKIGVIKKFIIPNNVKISAGEYKVFYSNETKITLNNSGDGVVLRNNKNNIAYETPVSNSVKEEQSYALYENENWFLTLMPTPGRKNIIKNEESDAQESYTHKYEISNNKNEFDSKTSDLTSRNYYTSQNSSTQENEFNIIYDYSDRIVISEIYPNPFGRDNRDGNYEWIELYNNSDEDVNLRGWRIDDILRKGSKAYIIKENKIIKARGFAVFENVQTKIMLNNSGDEVNILWPDGEIVDSLRYEKADEGLSYNWTPDSWVWSSKITPGKNNKTETVITKKKFKDNSKQGLVAGVKDTEDGFIEIEDAEINYIEANIKDIKHFEKYSRVKISGIVSTPPGILDNNVFYLYGSGIQIYSYNVKIPKINLGDEIEIIGRVSEVGGEKRILLDRLEDLKILSNNNLIEPKSVLTGNINESVEGYLVIVEGKVSQLKKDVFYIDDGSGEVKIYIKPQTKIKKPEIKKGDWMVITGQVSQTSLGYRILPRFYGDVKLSRVSGTLISQASSEDIGAVNEKNENTENKNSLLNMLFFIIVAFVLIDWGRMRVKKQKI